MTPHTLNIHLKMAAESEVFTIVILGPSFSGKSTFLHRLTTGTFDPNIESTTGIDLVLHECMIQDRSIQLKFWDTSGDPKFHTVISAYLRKADEYFLCYDVSNHASFIEAISTFMDLIRKDDRDHIPLTLVGIQKGDREVTFDVASEFASANQCRLVEICSRTGSGIQQLINTIELGPSS